MKRLCVFCGSSPGADPTFTEAAAHVGRLLATRGIGLVYGGGRVGLMGTLADAALAAGGEVIGVIPDSLMQWEVGHTGLTELRIVESMHARKAMMAELSDAFLALPGGFGTWEELCEVLTWAQLGLHRKPCAILNVSGYYDPLLALFDHAVEQRLLRPEHRALAITDTDPGRLLDRLATYQMPSLRKWIDRDET